MMHSRASSPSPADLKLTRLQYLVTVATRLKNTVTCLVIYIILIALNIIVMIWEYRGGSTRHWVAITLETIINVILTLEVATSILHQGRSYFQHYINIVDLTLTTICIIFFILFLSHPPNHNVVNNINTEDDSDGDTYSTIDLTVLIIRYVFQLTRISVIIYRSHRTTDVLVQEDVDFTVHEMRDKIEVEIEMSETEAATRDKMMMTLRERDTSGVAIGDPISSTRTMNLPSIINPIKHHMKKKKLLPQKLEDRVLLLLRANNRDRNNNSSVNARMLGADVMDDSMEGELKESKDDDIRHERELAGGIEEELRRNDLKEGDEEEVEEIILDDDSEDEEEHHDQINHHHPHQYNKQQHKIRHSNSANSITNSAAHNSNTGNGSGSGGGSGRDSGNSHKISMAVKRSISPASKNSNDTSSSNNTNNTHNNNTNNNNIINTTNNTNSNTAPSSGNSGNHRSSLSDQVRLSEEVSLSSEDEDEV